MSSAQQGVGGLHVSSDGSDAPSPPAPAANASTLIVPNGAGLAVIDDTLYASGTRVRVLSVLDDVDLLKTGPGSTRTVDNITVWATQSGVGRYVRRLKASATWAQQLDWGIDPLLGNDENVGTAAAPLRTPGEFSRRIPAGTLIALKMVVELLNDLERNDPLRINVQLPATPEADGAITQFVLKGRRSLLASGALTGYTPLSRTTGSTSRNVITAAMDFTPYLGETIVLTSGTGAGYSAQIQEAGVNTATITPWTLEHTSDTTLPPSAPLLQPAGIVAGNTFEIRHSISLGFSPQLIFSGGSFGSLTSAVQIRNVRNGLAGLSANVIEGAVFETRSPGALLYVIGCFLNVVFQGAGIVRMSNTLIGGGPCFPSSSMSVRIVSGGTAPVSGANIGGVSINGGVVGFDGDFAFMCGLFVGAASSVLTCFPGFVRLGNVGFFVPAGSGGPAVTLNPAAFCEVRTGEYGSHVVYGTSVGYAWKINAPATATYQATKPTINATLGVGRECNIGGTDTLYAAVPVVNPTNTAKFILAA